MKTVMPAVRTAACLFAASIALIGGCDQRSRIIDNGIAYPISMQQTRTVDAQVRRDGTQIVIVNATTTPIPAGRMWLNQWYGREFSGLGVGETVRLELSEFKDQYDRTYAAGGFFADRLPERVVLVQVQAEKELVGLVTVREPN